MRSLRPLPPVPRLFAAATFFSMWLVLLLRGYAGGGAVHLFLAAALAAFPWAALRPSQPLPTEHEEEDL